MNSAVKLNRKGPRYKAPRLNTLSDEWVSDELLPQDAIIRTNGRMYLIMPKINDSEAYKKTFQRICYYLAT